MNILPLVTTAQQTLSFAGLSIALLITAGILVKVSEKLQPVIRAIKYHLAIKLLEDVTRK